MHIIGHIINASSRVLFQVIGRPLSRWLNQGWLSVFLCLSSILLTPLVLPFQLDPSRHFLCHLLVVLNGSSSVCSCDAQGSVGVAEGMTCKPLTAHLVMHLVHHPFLQQFSTSSWYFNLSCASFNLSSQGAVKSKTSCPQILWQGWGTQAMKGRCGCRFFKWRLNQPIMKQFRAMREIFCFNFNC